MGIPRVPVPAGKRGKWEVVKDTPSDLEVIRNQIHGRALEKREYTRLLRNGSVVMSDTEAEYHDLRELRWAASDLVVPSRALLAGLGLGYALVLAAENKWVEHITVIEKEADVIALVGPTYEGLYGDRLEVIHADIFEWKPPRGSRWNVAWFDIWDNICADNLNEMKELRHKFCRRAKWRGCWSESQLLRR